MAKNKNSISDEKVKGAAGGYIEEDGNDYVVRNDKTELPMLRTNDRVRAQIADDFYKKGYSDGKFEAFEQMQENGLVK